MRNDRGRVGLKTRRAAAKVPHLDLAVAQVHLISPLLDLVYETAKHGAVTLTRVCGQSFETTGGIAEIIPAR